MPCSYFKVVWGFILIADPVPTVIQLLLGAFSAAACLFALGGLSSSSRVAWREWRADDVRCCDVHGCSSLSGCASEIPRGTVARRPVWLWAWWKEGLVSRVGNDCPGVWRVTGRSRPGCRFMPLKPGP